MVHASRTEGRWRYILAVVGWLILSAAQHPNPPAKPEQPKADAGIGNSLAHIAATLERHETKADRAPDSRPCQDKASDSQSALCAQWVAASAAKNATYLGAASFLLSVGGLIALIITLRQTNKTLRLAQKERATATRRAVANAADAAKALQIAERNADVAERAIAGMNRPYVILKLVRHNLPNGIQAAVENPVVWINFTNFGNSPATINKPLVLFSARSTS